MTGIKLIVKLKKLSQIRRLYIVIYVEVYGLLGIQASAQASSGSTAGLVVDAMPCPSNSLHEFPSTINIRPLSIPPIARCMAEYMRLIPLSDLFRLTTLRVNLHSLITSSGRSAATYLCCDLFVHLESSDLEMTVGVGRHETPVLGLRHLQGEWVNLYCSQGW